MKKLAIIDLGTNTFNMLIAEKNGRAVYKEKIAVKLGKNGISKGEIASDAYQRAIETMAYFKEVAEKQGASEIVAIATSAMRNARNGKELVKDIFDKTGIKVKVISGSEEAELIYYGVCQAMNLGEENSLIIDIGGGSVEFIIGNSKVILWKGSFEIGAQRLVDKFHKNDPITSDEVNALFKFLKDNLSPLFEAALKYKPNTLVGSSGTFDTLAEIDIKSKNLPVNYDEATEYSLKLSEYSSISKNIICKNRSDRMGIPGMVEMRVDMIVVACLLIDFILKNIEIANLRISSFALKEGALYKNF